MTSTATPSTTNDKMDLEGTLLVQPMKINQKGSPTTSSTLRKESPSRQTPNHRRDEVQSSEERLSRPYPGSLFFSTYPTRTPRQRMSSLLKPLETSANSTKRVRIKMPNVSNGVNSKPLSGRFRLLPLRDYTSSSQSVWKTPESKREYLDYLKKEIEKKKSERKQEDKQLRAPVIGIVPVMSQFQIGRPKRNEKTGELLDNKLPSTDITSRAIRNYEVTKKRLAYHDELEQQANARKQEAEQFRVRERQEAHKHYEAWTNFWGRPGCGAPRNANNHKKENLWQMLLDPKIVGKANK